MTAFITRMGLFLLIALFLSSSGRAAETVSENIPETILTPTSGWLVGPAIPLTGLPQPSAIPCLAVNQYDNGYNLRISVGQNALYALAFDFRHDLLEQGKTYALTLGVAPDFSGEFHGQAYNSHTLLINTRRSKEFYEALAEGPVLSLMMANHSLDFSLLGLPDGLQRAESCSQQDVIRKTGAETESPASGDRAARDKKSDYYANDLVTGAAVEENRPSPTPPEDIVVNYKRMPISETRRSEPHGGSETLENNAAPNAATTGATADIRQWRGLRGTNLRDVLDVWSQLAGVDFLWQSEREFPILETFTIKGSFEAAVSELLEQYQTEQTRPVGKMFQNRTSSGGKRTLLIESKKSD